MQAVSLSSMEEKENSFPLLGDKFPELEVTTTIGPLKLPAHFRGRWWLLFSHPADFTPVCTTEFVAFQKRWRQFQALKTNLIGLSVDQVFAHLKWQQWIKDQIGVEIKFPIIADDGQLARRLGLIHPQKGTNTVRAVFIVDPWARIRTILYYPQELGRNIDEILRIIKGLQLSDKEGVALPANWPENELFGADVIVPPATSLAELKKRQNAAKAGEIKCLDWWLCHRPSQKKSQ